MQENVKKKVIVVGGGFAGVEAAIDLDKKLFDVHLFSENDFLYIFPLSIWIPTTKKKTSDLFLSLKTLSKKHRFHFHQCKVQKLQLEKKEIQACGKAVSYDYLVLAHGSAKYQISGLEHTTTVCGSPKQAEILHDKYQALLKKGSGNIAVGFGGNPLDGGAVRGGPAFEVLFNMDNDLRKKKLRDNFTLTFFAPMKQPGKRMGENSVKKITKFLEKKNIQMKVGKKIISFTKDSIHLAESENISSDLTVFVSALEGSELSKNSGLPITKAGFLKASGGGQIEGQEFVFGAGDAIDFEGPAWKAKQGHMAEIQALTVAKNIKAHALKKPLKYNFVSKVNIICLMDFGNSGTFVYRDSKREFAFYLSTWGHFLKWAWGIYFKAVKLRYFPKLPGL